MRTSLQLALLVLALVSRASALDVGRTAPALGDVEWVKGGPIDLGDAGTKAKGMTVVEMWATWCAPCRQSIPHLTELQAKHPGIAFAGLTSEDAETVKSFVEKKGAEMVYHVGIVTDATWNTYMEDVEGPPRAYLVDAAGTVLWAGHPMALDPVLDQVEDGTFDAAKAKRIAVLEKALDERMQRMTEETYDAATPELIAETVEILALDPFDDKAIQVRMRISEHTRDRALMRATFATMPVERMTADRANAYAWKLATDENLANRNLDLAWAFAQRAVAADPANASCVDTQARVLYDLGLIDRAIATEERAVALDASDTGYVETLGFYRQVKRQVKEQMQELSGTLPATAGGTAP